MKFNWGTGIALFYSCFALSLMVILWIGKDEDVGLIAKDYYDLDIHYQDRIDKLQNSKNLSADIDIAIAEGGEVIRITFPDEIIDPKGEIQFLRPSDGKKDFKIPVGFTSGKIQDIPAGAMIGGLWRVSVDWTDQDKPYFKETYLML